VAATKDFLTLGGDWVHAEGEQKTYTQKKIEQIKREAEDDE